VNDLPKRRVGIGWLRPNISIKQTGVRHAAYVGRYEFTFLLSTLAMQILDPSDRFKIIYFPKVALGC